MTYAETIMPVLYGAVAGALAVAAAGFFWAGWTTEGAATAQSRQAVIAALVPVCVAQSRADPARAAKVATITAAAVRQRPAAVMTAGWATVLGTTTPDAALAEACIPGLDLAAG